MGRRVGGVGVESRGAAALKRPARGESDEGVGPRLRVRERRRPRRRHLADTWRTLGATWRTLGAPGSTPPVPSFVKVMGPSHISGHFYVDAPYGLSDWLPDETATLVLECDGEEWKTVWLVETKGGDVWWYRSLKKVFILYSRRPLINT